MARTKRTPELIKRVIELSGQGLSQQKIAREVGISQHLVGLILKEETADA